MTYKTGVTWLREGKLFSTVRSPFPFREKGAEVTEQVQHSLSVHLVEQRRGVPGDGHGRALDHGAGGRARSQPLLLFPPFSLLLLEPLLGHLPPVDRSVAVGPATTESGGVTCQKASPEQLSLPSLSKRSHAGGFVTTPPCCFHGNPQKQPAGDTGRCVPPAPLTLAAASAWSWTMAATVSGTGWTGVWCWPAAGTGGS